jgi:gliding motility-associated-like protein
MIAPVRKISCFVFLLTALLSSNRISAQLCDPNTPFFTANLSGNPNGTWISPSSVRNGHCCSSTNPDVCIEFIITLDSLATGINFNIASGAVPPGALYYQIDCGPPTAVGQPICLNGPGPYHITFCKPGNNQNTYSITSYAPPVINATISDIVSPQCTALISAQGTAFDEQTLSWTSIPFNATYNSFLSCTSGCDSAVVSPTGNLPPYVDYMVCGRGFDFCNSGAVCDTVRVLLYNQLNVSVSPSNVILCNGVSSTTITSAVSGGSGTYQYAWSDGQTTSSIAAGAGTYTLSVSDSVICNPVTVSSTVTVVPPVLCNAGNDMAICADQSSVTLNGTIQTATSAVWSGGNGTFSPNNTALNAVYTPSPFEIANGFVRLILRTTSNLGCPGASDTVDINIASLPVPSIAGNLFACSNSPVFYSAPAVAGTSYSWSVAGGVIIGSANSTPLTVNWGSGTSGTVTLTMTNSSGCAASTSSSVSISQPMMAAAGSDIMICENQNSISLNGSVQNATGFVWTGGSGVFSPNNTTLNAIYFPSAAEMTSGSVNLILQTSASQGCPAVSDTMHISIAPLPIPVIIGAVNICGSNPVIYNAPFEAGTSYSWTVTGGTISGSSNSTSLTVSWGSGTSGTVALTMTNSSGCAASTSSSVSISQPMMAAAGSDIMICENQNSISLNGSVQNATSFVWTGGSGVFSPSNSTLNAIYFPSAAEMTNGSVNLILQTSASQGCPAVSDTMHISIAPLPVPVIIGAVNICGSNPVIYNAPFEAGTSYSWTVTGGTISGSSNSSSLTVSWASGTTGTVALTMTNSSGCAASTSSSVSISQPMMAAAGSDITVCENQNSIPLNGSVQNATSFVWTGGSGVFSPNNSTLNAIYFPSAAEMTSGSVNLILQTSASQGCPAASDTILISISPLPVPVINGAVNICGSNPVIYNAPFQAGTNYLWTVTGGTISGFSNSSSLTVSWGSGTSGTVALTMTNSSGCAASTTSSIIISQPVSANAGNNVTICESQQSIPLNGTLQNASSLSWTGGTGIFIPDNTVLNPTYVPSAADISSGSVWIFLQTPPNQGCPAAIDSIQINIVTEPEAIITGSQVACANSLAIYSAPLAAGCSYVWTVTGGVINGPANSNSVNTSWGSGGNGTVTLTVANANGCTQTSTQNISLVVLPNPVIEGNTITCQQSLALYSVNPSPGSTYIWNTVNGSIFGNNYGSPVQVNWTNPGSGLVTVVETNSYGCIQSDTVAVTVAEQPIPSISGTDVICIGGNVSVYTAPIMSNVSYSWTVTGGTITSGNGSNVINVLWNSDGINNVMLVVSNSSGCDSTVVFLVTVSSVNAPSLQSSGLNGCPPLSVAFTGNQIAQGQAYYWTFGDQGFSTSPNPVHIYNTPSNYQVSVFTQNNDGCTDSASATVKIFDQPQASFNHNFEETIYYIGESSLEITNTTVHGTSYSWTFGTGETIQVFEPEKIFEEEGDYLITLVSVNPEGCADTAVKEIHVRNHEHIYVANAFTPNNDGTNDFFSMLHENMKEATVDIFNRWGRNIFSSSDKDFKWDGTYAGHSVENGVYVYKIYAIGESGKTYTRIGTVSVIR